MPRKPTHLARAARTALIERVHALPPEVCLPPLVVLANDFQLHPSTIFRILRDLVAEGIVWQSPKGKFFAAAHRRKALRGAAVCFVGREVWQWSRLYQEVLNGISEVCAANESPLLTCSSRLLVRQSHPTEPPVFARASMQNVEIARLLQTIPKHCAGLILDHVWLERVLARQRWPGGARLRVFGNSSPICPGLYLDYHAAATIIADYLARKDLRRVALVNPFQGDPAIDTAFSCLRESLRQFKTVEIAYSAYRDVPKKLRAALLRMDAVVCPEDNIALAIAQILPARGPQLIGTQGTGVLHAPHVRLRYDFRRIGRAAAAFVLHGRPLGITVPTLVDPAAADGVLLPRPPWPKGED
jgi:DNA-binding LacI/PurR family transcriptional regulator